MRSKRVILIDGAGLHRARREREKDRKRGSEGERKPGRGGGGRTPGTRGRVALDGGIREGVVARGS